MYVCKKRRISCLAFPSSSHAFANFTLNSSAFFLNSCPFLPRHKSIVCRTSTPTASRVPSGVSPFLWMRFRPSPVLTWNSSKAAFRFSVTWAAAAGWSAVMGQQILQKRKGKSIKSIKSACRSEENTYKGIPLARDSVMLLKPPCVTNHPVAYNFILSIELR